MRVKNKPEFKYAKYIFADAGRGSYVYVDGTFEYLVSIFKDTTLSTHHNNGRYMGFGDNYSYRWTEI